MSAHIVDDNVINSVINFIKMNNRYAEVRYSHNAFIQSFEINASHRDSEKNCQSVAQILLNENYKSVNARYSEKNSGTIKYKNEKSITLAQCASNIKNIEYQSCEHNDYYETEGYKALTSLKDSLLSIVSELETTKWGM